MSDQGRVLMTEIAPAREDQALIISVKSGDYTHALARDADGRVVAAFHRNLKTAEAKL